MREVKSFPVAEFKALDDSGTAQILVSVFGNVDRVKDIVERGAFARVITGQKRAPKFMPDHSWSVLHSLGKVLAWQESDDGVVVDVKFNLEKQIAKDVYSDWKFNPEGQEFSFSYEIEREQTDKDGIRHIYDFKEVFDVGPVGIGANPETGLLSVKSIEAMIADTKAGRRDSASTLKVLQTAHGHAKQVETILATYIQESSNAESADDGKSLLTVESDFINTIETSLLLTDLRLTGVQS